MPPYSRDSSRGFVGVVLFFSLRPLLLSRGLLEMLLALIFISIFKFEILFL